MHLVESKLFHCWIPPRSCRDLLCRWVTKSLLSCPSHRTSLGWAQGCSLCMCAPIASYFILRCLLWTVSGVLPSVLTSQCESVNERSCPLRVQVEKVSMRIGRHGRPDLEKSNLKKVINFTDVIVAKNLRLQLILECRMDSFDKRIGSGIIHRCLLCFDAVRM